MSVYLNVELNVIVILLIAAILYKVKKSVDQQTTNVLFSYVLWATLFMSLFEASSNLLNSFGLTSPVGLFFLNVAAVLRYSGSGYMSYTWCMYLLFESEVLAKKFFNSRLNRILVAVPAIILLAATVLSPWTGWIFTVDGANGTFSRGSCFYIQVAVTYIYFAAASAATMIFLLLKKNRQHVLTQVLFVVTPFIGGMIHLVAPELSVVWPLLAILLMVKFLGIQEDQIFIDGLTGLNNRRSFDKFLSSMLVDHSGKDVILYMIDVDHFKVINDTYGHVEGDNALVHTAEILRKVCGGKNAFLARYGGDEFAIVYQETERENAASFNHRIITEFERYNKLSRTGSKYSINISVGYASAIRNGKGNEIQLLRKADAALYENKRNHALVSFSN